MWKQLQLQKDEHSKEKCVSHIKRQISEKRIQNIQLH